MDQEECMRLAPIDLGLLLAFLVCVALSPRVFPWGDGEEVRLRHEIERLEGELAKIEERAPGMLEALEHRRNVFRFRIETISCVLRGDGPQELRDEWNRAGTQATGGTP